MPINANEFSRALRARYKSPAAVLRKLGLDADLYGSGAGTSQNGGNGNGNGDRPELNGACFHLISEHLKGLLDAHQLAELTGRLKHFMPAPTADEDPPLVEPSPVKNMGSGLDEPPELEKFREHLRRKGNLDDEAIDHAVGLARDYMKHRRSNGADKLPVSGVHGGFGGKFSGRTRDNDDFAERFPEAARIEGEAPRDGGRDRRHAMDKAPSRKARARLDAKFGTERIRGDGWDGEIIPPADLRSETERRFPDMTRIGT